MNTTHTYYEGKYTCHTCKKVDDTYSCTCNGCGRDNISLAK